MFIAAEPSFLDRVGDLAPVIAAVMSGFLALGGVLVGKRWERHSDKEAWRRDRRLDTYARGLSAAHSVWATLSINIPQGQHERSPGDMDAFDRAYEAMELVACEIAILGPEEVSTVFDHLEATYEQLDEAVNEWFKKEFEARGDFPTSSTAVDGSPSDVCVDALQGFVVAARRALG